MHGLCIWHDETDRMRVRPCRFVTDIFLVSKYLPPDITVRAGQTLQIGQIKPALMLLHDLHLQGWVKNNITPHNARFTESGRWPGL